MCLVAWSSGSTWFSPQVDSQRTGRSLLFLQRSLRRPADPPPLSRELFFRRGRKRGAERWGAEGRQRHVYTPPCFPVSVTGTPGDRRRGHGTCSRSSRVTFPYTKIVSPKLPVRSVTRAPRRTGSRARLHAAGWVANAAAQPRGAAGGGEHAAGPRRGDRSADQGRRRTAVRMPLEQPRTPQRPPRIPLDGGAETAGTSEHAAAPVRDAAALVDESAGRVMDTAGRAWLPRDASDAAGASRQPLGS